MKINKNDPRLTAYVLNELDALEKSMIQIALKSDPELQSEVAQIKRSIGVFNTLAQSQDEMALSKTQREKLFEKPTSSPRWSIWTIGGSLATAGLALILFQQNEHEKSELLVSVPVTKSLSVVAQKKAAPAKEQLAKVEQKEAPAEVGTVADSFAEAKMAEPHQEFESAKNSMSTGALGASAGAGADSDSRSVSKSKSATAVARPMLAARMAKDEAPAPAAPTATAAPAQARKRLQELPLELNVSLSQFLPTETEPADVEISMNLTRDLKKCFAENLSKYVRYNMKFNLKWNMQKTKPVNVQISDPMTTGLITAEIQNCVKQSFESQDWSDVKYIRDALKPLKLEAVATIVSE